MIGRWLNMLLISLMMVSCTNFKSTRYNEENPCYLKLADEVDSLFIRDITQCKQFSVIGRGGAMAYDIEQWDLMFKSCQSLTIDQARVQYVYLAEEFLRRVNAWEIIRPYLHNYPVTIANLELVLLYTDRHSNLQSGEKVASVKVVNGVLIYTTFDHINHKFVDLQEEPYEEAMRLVREQHFELFSMPFAIYNLFTYRRQ